MMDNAATVALRDAAAKVLYAWHDDRALLEEAMESLKRACFWPELVEGEATP